ncbi:MAG: diguanylate cyclase [Acidobacteriota bacterium]
MKDTADREPAALSVSRDRSIRALLSLVDALAVGRDEQELLYISLERLVEALELDGGVVFLVQPEGRPVAAADIGVGTSGKAAAEAVAQDVLMNLRPVMSVRSEGDAWTGTALLAPDKPLGVLTLVDRGATREALSEELVMALGKQIGTGLASARASAELRASLVRREVLSRLTNALTSSMEIRNVVPAFAQELATFLSFDRMAMGFLNDSGDYIEITPYPEETDWGLGHVIPVVASGLGSVVLNGQPVLQEDLVHRHRFIEDMRLLEDGIRSYVLLPLTTRGRAIGALALGSIRERTYDSSTIDLLQPFTDSVSLVLDNIRLFQKTRDLSITDEVTPLYNVRFFHQMLDRELRFVDRYGSCLSLVFIDLDRFKPVNDQYGHLRGSRALREVGFLLRTAVRDTDYPARYGGDEFVIILPQTDRADAEYIALKLRSIIEQHTFLQEEGINVKLGASYGVATYPHEAQTKESLIRLADSRMYEDKERRQPSS